MDPYWTDDAESVTLYHADCRDVMASMPDASVDAIVTDPPYELGFMGRSWDASGIAYDPAMWAEALRVLKPGGHLLAFGGTRTWHRMVCAIEDAGFEIRDNLQWLYAAGFPKSLDVSKAIDRQRDDRPDIRKVTAWIADVRNARGVLNREIDNAFGFNGMAGHWTSRSQAAVPTLDQVPLLLDVLGLSLDEVPDEIRDLLWTLNGNKGQPGPNWAKRDVVGTVVRMNEPSGIVSAGQGERVQVVRQITTPATPAATQWHGWGTALKPAVEPICLARKPLVGTVAANVLEHGTGALNIDGCRVGLASEADERESKGKNRHADFGTAPGGNAVYGDFTMVERTNYDPPGRWPANVLLDEDAAAMLDEQSGWSKAPSTVTRGAGGQHGAYSPIGRQEDVPCYGDSGGASRFFYVAKAATHERPRLDDGTAHPTVKPVALMRWLVRLVTPPGGVVLDPFAGSGTTAEACVVEGFRCVLIEGAEEYLPLIVQRLTKPIQAVLL